MSKDMLGTIVRKLVTLPAEVLGIVFDFLEKLADPEWVTASKKFLRKEEAWLKDEELSATIKFNKLLKCVASMAVPEMTEKFVTNWNFQDDPAIARFRMRVSPNFYDRFGGTAVPPCAARKMNICKLVKCSKDRPIIDELGGESSVEVNLAQVFWMISQQPDRMYGKLCTNGNMNIFYVRNNEGTLNVIRCFCSPDLRCWCVDAFDIDHPDGQWLQGDYIIS